MPSPRVVRMATGGLAVCALAISAAAVVPANAASHRAAATMPSRAYRAHDYAHGQAMSILPPGENGLVTGPQILAYEADNNNRPPHSHDQFDKYANLLYGYHGLKDS